MSEVIQGYDLIQWGLVMLAAFLIGMGKAGLKGIDMLNVTLMAIVFGGKSSTGIVLPLLCVADIAAVSYYNRYAKWKYFWKLVPWMMIGILMGVFIGRDMDEQLFKKIIAGIVLVSIAIVFVMEYRKSTEVPDHLFFTIPTGLAAGFTTMMGNLAGAFANLYFLAMRLGKNDFIGTGAWVFLFMNLFKLPFQIFYWENINATTLKVDLVLIPALAAGFWIGLKIVSRFNDTQFRKLIIVLTLIGSLLMLMR